MVIVWHGFHSVQGSTAVFVAFFEGPNIPLSKGCNLCKMYGAKEYGTIPESLRLLISSVEY